MMLRPCSSSSAAKEKPQTYRSQQDSALISTRAGTPSLLETEQSFAQTHLEEESVPEGVAEAEDKVLLGVLGHSLHDAVLHPHGVLGDAVVVDARPAVRLVEEQRAACRDSEVPCWC